MKHFSIDKLAKDMACHVPTIAIKLSGPVSYTPQNKNALLEREARFAWRGAALPLLQPFAIAFEKLAPFGTTDRRDETWKRNIRHITGLTRRLGQAHAALLGGASSLFV